VPRCVRQITSPNTADEWRLADLHALLKPHPAELMTVSAANVLVNNAKNEGPQPLEPAA
jgi:hypothetical protein